MIEMFGKEDFSCIVNILLHDVYYASCFGITEMCAREWLSQRFGKVGAHTYHPVFLLISMFSLFIERFAFGNRSIYFIMKKYNPLSFSQIGISFFPLLLTNIYRQKYKSRFTYFQETT